MQLQPRRPPGRIDRKAAAYACEIVRLRTAGYTYEAIREALADVGIQASTSALRREVRRSRTVAPSVPARTPPPAPPTPPSPRPPRPPPQANGREIAAAFFAANPGNPLLRKDPRP